MCKRYILKFTIISLFLIINCISIPESPKNNSEECLAYFLHSKREMKDIQQENRQTNAIIGGISFTLFYGFGFPGLVPLFALPYYQKVNQDKINNIESELNKKYCIT